MAEKILIVDDSNTNRLLLSVILRKSGFETVEACDGEEAVACALEVMPDLILLDVMMPRMDGYEACRLLKEHEKTRDIPVVFLSAKAEAGDKIKGLELGGADYVTKPFNKGEVLARVRSQLKIRSLSRKLMETNRELSEKQRRLDEDLKMAAVIQQSLLPQKTPFFNDITITWRFKPCEHLGGDILNVFQLDAEHLGMYIIDISGHGVPAALVTMSVYHMLQVNSGYVTKEWKEPPFYRLAGPAEVCDSLDKEYPIERFDKYFTIVYLICDLAGKTIKYCNAAHPPPVLLRNDGTLELLDKGGTIVGMGGIMAFEEDTRRFYPGDKIVFYTDGVTETERPGGDFYGVERLHAILQRRRREPISDLLDSLLDDLNAFAGDARRMDDVTLLGIEFK